MPPDTASEKIAIAIIDTNPMGSQLLAEVLSRDDRFEIVECASEPPTPLRKNVNVALISSTLASKLGSGYQLAHEFASRAGTRTVMLIEESTPESVFQAFRSGARGVFSRRDSVKALPKCIQSVHSGQVWASNQEIEYLLSMIGERAPSRLIDAKGRLLLSKREQDVVAYVIEGLTNREIAKHLSLSEHTIKNYLFRIFEKLGISTRAELIVYALSQISANQAAAKSKRAFTSDDLGLEGLLDIAEHCYVAPYRLGEIYRDGGEGVSIDKVTAYMWFLITQSVCTRMYKKGQVAGSEIRAGLLSAQITEAERRAQQWLQRFEQLDMIAAKEYLPLLST
jgi:two-component system nitrate/nitrite response regulator NarL